MSEILTVARGHGGVATLTLNRPEAHNALNGELVGHLIESFRQVGADENVRAVVLAAVGKSFCAGADLAGMRNAGRGESYLAEAKALAVLMSELAGLPKPMVAVVQGPAYGGGIGLIAACDVAIAVDTATFALSEVRLGLIPAVIAPYVVRAIGARQTRRLALTAETISAEAAKDLGLIHHVVAAGELAAERDRQLAALARAGPKAVVGIKELIDWLDGMNSDMADETARRLSQALASEEGREGIAAFLEKRRPRGRN